MVFQKPAKEGRLLAALLFSIGILQIAGYWFAGAMVNGSGPLAIPQPDTPLYLQSALRVAQGFPFSFSSGAAVCTGSTTVLHPFLFSVPFLLGVSPEAAVAVAFVVNAVFYLIFLGAWGVVIRRWVSDPVARLLAVVMLVLFGQAAYAAMALSDIGLWLAVSGLFVAGLSTGRRRLYGPMLVLGPWIRPEGMVVVIAFIMVLAAFRVFAKERLRFDRADLLLAVAGILSVLGVFALNYALSGEFQFASMAKKGHFATRPFFAAVYCTANDLLRMASSFFFGLTDDPPRQFYMLPVAGAVMFWVGAATHEWGDWRKFVFPLAAAGGFWTVATSGWQNTNVDRYLAWMLPLVVILSAEGFAFMYRRISRFRGSVSVLALPIAFAVGSSVTFWSLFHVAAVQSDVLMKFGRELDAAIPDRTTVGLTGNCGLAYPLQHHGVRTLYGIYSPEFEGPLIAYAMETLKNRRETRFDYWVFAADDDFPRGFPKTQGEPLLIGPDGLNVRKAEWSVFDASAAAPDRMAPGMMLKQRVDIGYPADERQAGYAAETRFGLPPLTVFQHVGELDGRNAYEAGRVVWGMDSMSVELEPGKDLRVVMRTLRDVDAGIPTPLGAERRKHYDFGAKQALRISVDGKIFGTANYEAGEKGFTDVVLSVPGSAIVNPVSRIAFLGDHIVCAYWFYQ